MKKHLKNLILIVILIGLIISTKPNLIYTYAKSTINEQKIFVVQQ